MAFRSLIKEDPGFVFKLVELALALTGTLFMDINLFVDVHIFILLVVAMPAYAFIMMALILSYMANDKPNKFLLRFFLVGGVTFNLVGGVASLCDYIPFAGVPEAGEILILAFLAFINAGVMLVDLLKENKKLCCFV